VLGRNNIWQLQQAPGVTLGGPAGMAMLLVAMLCLQSCFKEKNLKPKDSTSSDQLVVIPMGSTYENQFFYSLDQNKVVSQNSNLVYDLMFDCANGRYNIWLNSSKLMQVKRTGKFSMGDVSPADTLGSDGFKLDKATYEPDSNAIGYWYTLDGSAVKTRNEVYLVQLGKDNFGYGLGYVKMQVTSYAANSYNITFAALDGSNEQTAAIAKDANYCYRYFTFSNGGNLVNVEPGKADWDIVFTRYSYVFYDPYYLPYIVVGALNNPERVEAYVDSVAAFDSLKAGNLQTNLFSSRRDVIGYDWKYYDFTSYQTLTYKNYLLKVDGEKLYKLRFLNFYNANEERGYPTFEYEEI
jgi:hypothetical protein